MQKFHRGDYVKVAKDLGLSMSHFTSDCNAIVLASYADLYPNISRDKINTKTYEIFIENKGEVAWYKERQLELVSSNRLDILYKWQEKDVDNEPEGSVVEVTRGWRGGSIKEYRAVDLERFTMEQTPLEAQEELKNVKRDCVRDNEEVQNLPYEQSECSVATLKNEVRSLPSHLL